MAQFLVKAFKSLQNGIGFPVLLGILATLVLIGYLILYALVM
ncbi:MULTISPECIES: hypothetical protein [Gluconobacter]|jgi:hypothetical protein|uniref:Uncharacterized protein n=2 Tax=Gluconobacter TaxID=441 RepID=A0ABQ0Q9M0_9PROT|nr:MULTISPECIES: hypothetical protein [Gluconobacter]AFW02994.1 hypothetical protein B932_3455 [Gluconobacter oxydans H24]OAG74693.1 hypothetical protein A0J51_00231 [Gluconobacter japonicus]GAN89963.1 hypothetical protein Gbfr_010_038 [Gluconobacter frateurii M-2]GAC87017.1 hypothetical protein NBRC3255_0678 [Gluconobacter thailandicus NBRC 3255]GAD27463.1 hypothetical protein NBRC3257_2462 [Gluconobacter thailandicus NBRC 3257]